MRRIEWSKDALADIDRITGARVHRGGEGSQAVKRLQWEPEARADLIRIAEYSSDKDPRVAELLFERIEQAAAALARFDTGRPGRMPNLHISQNWTPEAWPKDA